MIREIDGYWDRFQYVQEEEEGLMNVERTYRDRTSSDDVIAMVRFVNRLFGVEW